MAYVYNSLLTPQKWFSDTVVCVTANTDYDDGPGAGVLKLMTAGPNGGLLTRLHAMPRGTVAATQLQVYSSLDAGVTKHLIDSALMGAFVFGSNLAIPKTEFLYTQSSALELSPNEELWVGIGVSLAAGIAFRAGWGDF